MSFWWFILQFRQYSYYTASSNGKLVDTRGIGKDFEGKVRGLIVVLLQNFLGGTEEDHE